MSKILGIALIGICVSCAPTAQRPPTVPMELQPVSGGAMKPTRELEPAQSPNLDQYAFANYGDMTASASVSERDQIVRVHFVFSNLGDSVISLDLGGVTVSGYSGQSLRRMSASAVANGMLAGLSGVQNYTPKKNIVVTSRTDASGVTRSTVGTLTPLLEQLSAQDRNRRAERMRALIRENAQHAYDDGFPDDAFPLPPQSWVSGTLYFRRTEGAPYTVRIGNAATRFEYAAARSGGG